MGSAAPAPERELIPDPVTDRRDVASYVSADATMQPVLDALGKDTSSTRAVRSAEERALAPEGGPTPEPQLPASPDLDRLQAAVLQALSDGNQRILVSMLSAGEWSVQGNELIIKLAESQTVIDMSLGPDARRLAIASASDVLGRALKVRVVPVATVAPQENKRNGAPARSSGPGGRGRAEQDPVVRRMQEKFDAEIRTVIDYREKR